MRSRPPSRPVAPALAAKELATCAPEACMPSGSIALAHCFGLFLLMPAPCCCCLQTCSSADLPRAQTFETGAVEGRVCAPSSERTRQ